MPNRLGFAAAAALVMPLVPFHAPGARMYVFGGKRISTRADGEFDLRECPLPLRVDERGQVLLAQPVRKIGRAPERAGARAGGVEQHLVEAPRA